MENKPLLTSPHVSAFATSSSNARSQRPPFTNANSQTHDISATDPESSYNSRPRGTPGQHQTVETVDKDHIGLQNHYSLYGSLSPLTSEDETGSDAKNLKDPHVVFDVPKGTEDFEYENSEDDFSDSESSDETCSLSEWSDLGTDFGGLLIAIDRFFLSLRRPAAIFKFGAKISGWNEARLDPEADYQIYPSARELHISSREPAFVGGVWSLITPSKLTILRLYNVFFDYEGLYSNYVVDLLRQCFNLKEARFLIPRNDGHHHVVTLVVRCPKLEILSLIFVGFDYSADQILPQLVCPKLLHFAIKHKAPGVPLPIVDIDDQKRILSDFVMRSSFPRIQNLDFDSVPWIFTQDLATLMRSLHSSLSSLKLRRCPNIELARFVNLMTILEKTSRWSPPIAPNLECLVLSSDEVLPKGLQWDMRNMLDSRRCVPTLQKSSYLTTAVFALNFGSEISGASGDDEYYSKEFSTDHEKEEQKRDDSFRFVIDAFSVIEVHRDEVCYVKGQPRSCRTKLS
ncbi:hypothetical protein VKT23_017654 [Stygiomarasmius scandens]|uniref:Uncharacterized protein n=1 Tax=Marasmiellus scandens TaxID=2682957 RepID=A0ABR1IRC6_9AGAR